jgi:5-methylthioadenosine/S-adenosylhomocysteine deaminase
MGARGIRGAVSLAIHDALLPDGREASVYVEDDRIVEIGRRREADVTIDGRGKALLPGLVNTHTHAAMALLRGYADDMALQDWLTEKIWPAEAKLTPDAIYWGTKLACLEMIKTGTTCFNDMYFHMDRAAQAVHEMGLRAYLSEGFIDLLDAARGETLLKENERILNRIAAFGSKRVVPAVGPHAIYTVSKESLRALKDLADARGCVYHIHVGETSQEVEDSKDDHGKSPVQLLDSLGVLGPNVVAAHAVWLDDADIRTFAERGVKVAHCPVSNMKLAVSRAMPLDVMRAAGLTVSLGTDGPASNNNLDMFQTMKAAALLHKFATGEPTTATARTIFDLATVGGARALGFPGGEVAVGKIADLILLDLERPELTPRHDLVSNVVYAATGSCVDTVICDGRVIMEHREVPGEREILGHAAKIARELFGRP